MTSRHLIMMLVSALALSVAPACGDNNDPAAENNPNNDDNNSENNDTCGAGKIQASFEGGAAKCYVSCTDDSGCGLEVCRDADGGAGKICVPAATSSCNAGEVEASYQGQTQCYKACANDAACGDATQECKDADGGGAKVCVLKQDTSGPCDPFLEYSGQIFDKPEDPTYGGTVAADTSGYSDDSGIEAFNTFIRGKYDAAPGEELSEDFEDGSELQITEATITSTNFEGNAWFGVTIEDKKGTATIFLDGREVTVPETLPKVGDKVSFKIDSYSIYRGETPQISEISDYTVVSSDNPVRVRDLTGEEVSGIGVNEIVRIGGKITEVTNATCGGSAKCYNLQHGEEGSEKNITYRTSSTFAKVGDCITYVGPLNLYPQYSESPQPQLNVLNFSWVWTPIN